MFTTIIEIVAIIGALAVARNKALFANVVWSFSNPLLVWSSLDNNMTGRAVMFTVFTVVAWYGVYNMSSERLIRFYRRFKNQYRIHKHRLSLWMILKMSWIQSKRTLEERRDFVDLERAKLENIEV